MSLMQATECTISINVIVLYVHMRLTVNGVVKGYVNKLLSLVTEVNL
jgi:hypothetical protein